MQTDIRTKGNRAESRVVEVRGRLSVEEVTSKRTKNRRRYASSPHVLRLSRSRSLSPLYLFMLFPFFVSSPSLPPSSSLILNLSCRDTPSTETIHLLSPLLALLSTKNAQRERSSQSRSAHSPSPNDHRSAQTPVSLEWTWLFHPFRRCFSSIN